MADRRLTPANARVAASYLRDEAVADRYTEGQAAQVVAPLADLRAAPQGARDRQLSLGEAVTVYETHAGWAFVD